MIFRTCAKFPALAGDMLISVPEPAANTDLKLPSQPNGIIVPPTELPDYVPIGMRRKIFIVNDHLAVGASGSALHIERFLGRVFEELHDRTNFTRYEVEDFFNRLISGPEGREVLEQVGLLVSANATDWKGWIVAGKAARKQVFSQHLGPVVAIGSGANSVVEEARRGYLWGRGQAYANSSILSELDSLVLNLHLLAKLYWREFSSPERVFDAWGGAYDLIYHDSNNRFRYVDDYTIFLRRFDADEPEKGLQLINVLKYERRTEVSLIMMFNDKGGLHLFGARDITDSNGFKKVAITKDVLTMNSRVHVSLIEVGKRGKSLEPLIQVEILDPSQSDSQTARPRAFVDLHDGVQWGIYFKAEHDKWLEQQVKSYYEERAHLFS